MAVAALSLSLFVGAFATSSVEAAGVADPRSCGLLGFDCEPVSARDSFNGSWALASGDGYNCQPEPLVAGAFQCYAATIVHPITIPTGFDGSVGITLINHGPDDLTIQVTGSVSGGVGVYLPAGGTDGSTHTYSLANVCSGETDQLSLDFGGSSPWDTSYIQSVDFTPSSVPDPSCPDSVPTSTSTATATTTSTVTATPTVTPGGPTSTGTATATATPTVNLSASPTATATPVERNCGDASFPLLNCDWVGASGITGPGEPDHWTNNSYSPVVLSCSQGGGTPYNDVLFSNYFSTGDELCAQPVVAGATGELYIEFNQSVNQGSPDFVFSVNGGSVGASLFSCPQAYSTTSGSYCVFDAGPVVSGTLYTAAIYQQSNSGQRYSSIYIHKVWVGSSVATQTPTPTEGPPTWTPTPILSATPVPSSTCALFEGISWDCGSGTPSPSPSSVLSPTPFSTPTLLVEPSSTATSTPLVSPTPGGPIVVVVGGGDCGMVCQ